MRTLCHITGKERFRTKGSALKASRNMEKQHRGMTSVYLCAECNAWHLTHYSYQESKHFGRFPRQEKKRDMRIFVDTIEKGEAVMVEPYRPPEQERSAIMLAFQQKSGVEAVGLTYEQALELVEALKIQIAKI